MTDGWEEAYKRRPTAGYLQRGSHEPRLEEVVPLLKASGARRVLDLGCGDGRNMVYLASVGFAPSGVDHAPTGISQARAWLAREGVEPDLKVGEMCRLDWPAECFDAAISIMAFHHQTQAQLKDALAELRRVLVPGGVFFADLMHAGDADDWIARKQAKQIETGTWVPTIGHEAGVVHHMFERDEIARLFDGFELRLEDTHDRFWIIAHKEKPLT